MKIFRNKKTGRLYKMFRVTPRMYATTFYEAEDLITGEVIRCNTSPGKREKDFVHAYNA